VAAATRTGPWARLRDYAARLTVAGAVLAGMAAGCSSQPAVTQGSAPSCFQFALTAIHRHVVVTGRPAACQGLTQLEVNVAVNRAIRDAAAGVRGKVRQRQLIARDGSYVASLIHPVTSPGQPAGPAPPSHLPSRSALALAALVAWLLTVGLGVSMMARWISRTRRHGTQPGHGRGPVLNLTHFGLALAGLLVWISYLATGVTGLAWAACGVLIAVVSLGMTLVFLPTASADPSGNDPAPRRRPPVPVIAAHITAASITILLATLAAAGSG
jgi:manganese efflux pump family protein